MEYRDTNLVVLNGRTKTQQFFLIALEGSDVQANTTDCSFWMTQEARRGRKETDSLPTLALVSTVEPGKMYSHKLKAMMPRECLG
jgi:hypothetical protein